ncbi:MAG: hypothetical protein HY960_08440 [Ignavibacteriae bacterium]|nr:hypothetical protein [Ignavibacteriota bacterium]
MPDYKNLKLYLQKICTNSITKSELTELIKISRVLVHAHLTYIRSSLSHLYQQQGLSAEDVAWDCLGNVFIKDQDFQYPLFLRFKQSLNAPLETLPDEEVLSAYKRLLTTIADKQLARLFGQNDSEGAKIHRNIRDCVKQTTLFTLQKDGRGLFIKPASHDSLEHLKIFPPEQLTTEFLSRLDHRRTTKNLLEELHTILVGQAEYRRTVLLVDVTQLFKKVFHGQEEFSEDNTQLQFSHISDIDIQMMCSQVRTALKEKIVFTYLTHGKINRSDAQAMFSAFEDMIDDWLSDSGLSQSLYYYVNRYLPMPESVYNASYRTKMEYLLKFVREEFHSHLMDDV